MRLLTLSMILIINPVGDIIAGHNFIVKKSTINNYVSSLECLIVFQLVSCLRSV